MKKFCAVVMSIVLVLGCFAPSAFSAEKPESTPTILISGFMCSDLYLNYGKTDKEKVWAPDAGRIADEIGKDAGRLASALFGLFTGKKEQFGQVLGKKIADVIEPLRINADGVSAYPVSHYPNSPEYSNIKYMKENCPEAMYEVNFCNYLAETTDPSNVFVFNYDSRLGAITLAKEFRNFVESVRAYTGSEKVNIFALSYGGMIVSSYLYLYPDDNAAHKIVLCVPAIGGTDLPDRLLRGNVGFDLHTVVSFFETILGGEANFARFFEDRSSEEISYIVSVACKEALSPVRYWGSLWSLCSPELYGGMKKDFLDPVTNAGLIEETDKVQYEIRPKLAELYKECRSEGMEISVICGHGSTLVTGGKLNGDFILPASGVSGATVVPTGKRFADGYRSNATCGDSGHNHVSPSMEIDATGCYLPENTWFVEGQYHGQYYYEEYTRKLVTKLLFTDDIKDVYSDPEFPQFEYSKHSYRNIHAKFDKSQSGYLADNDKCLVVKNLSESNYMKILSVVSYGIELEFEKAEGLLAPGESVRIPFDVVIPPKGSTAARLTVSYIEIGSPNFLNTADFDITAIGDGKSTSEAKTVDYGFASKLESSVSPWLYRLIVSLSLRNAVECIFNSIIS